MGGSLIFFQHASKLYTIFPLNVETNNPYSTYAAVYHFRVQNLFLTSQ